MDDETHFMAGLLHDFGEAWQIQPVPGSDRWIAIERPLVRVARFHLADSPAELRGLLEADARSAPR